MNRCKSALTDGACEAEHPLIRHQGRSATSYGPEAEFRAPAPAWPFSTYLARSCVLLLLFCRSLMSPALNVSLARQKYICTGATFSALLFSCGMTFDEAEVFSPTYLPASTESANKRLVRLVTECPA